MNENQNNKKMTIENLKVITDLVTTGKVKNLSKNLSELKKNIEIVLYDIKSKQISLTKQDELPENISSEKVEIETPQKETEHSEEIKNLKEEKSSVVENFEPTTENISSDSNEKIEKVEKVAKTEKAEKPEKIEKTEKVAKAPKAEKVEKVTKVEKIEKFTETEKMKKTEKVEKTENVENEIAHVDVEKKADKVEVIKEVKDSDVIQPVETNEPMKDKEVPVEESTEPKIFQSTSAESAAQRALAIQERIRLRMIENGTPPRPRRFENSRPNTGGFQGNNGGGQGYQGNNPRPGGYNNSNNGNFNNRPSGGYNNNNNTGGYNNRPNTGGRPGYTPFANKDDDQKKVFPKKVEKKPAQVFAPKDAAAKNFVKKKDSKIDEKKAMTKRTLIRKGFIQHDDVLADGKMGSRKLKSKKRQTMQVVQMQKIEHAVVTTDVILIKTLSEKIGVTAVSITKKLFADGVIKTVNESIDFATAEEIALSYDIILEYKPEVTAEDILTQSFDEVEDKQEDLMERPPVVTVMGHVDHGKTSLLDYIKNSKVTQGEAGGITQHIGSYSIELRGRKITFIDTPGHEAFTSMRKRGAEITDIAILVVAADDGLMPQTVEAIKHIKAAGVEMIVAMNKIDKPTADTNKILQQLTEHEVLTEAWGGTTIAVPVSATTGEGVDNLLESILTISDVLELKANPNKAASGTIIEAKLDKGKGPVATILVKNGTLNIGDTVVSGFTSGRIRAMLDEKGTSLKTAGPSMAVSVLGFKDVPEAGESIMAVPGGKLSKQVINERIAKIKDSMIQIQQKFTLEDAFKNIQDGEIKNLNLIIKGDVQGSVEAVKQSLEKLANDEVRVRVLHHAVGAISESDVMLAAASSAIIISFNLRPDTKIKQVAEKNGVEIRVYRVIYDTIEDVKLSLTGMLAPILKEIEIGTFDVRTIFKITGTGIVAGGYVTTGKIQRNAKVRLIRDSVVVFEGDIDSLKRMKEDVKEVAHGYECGISLKGYQDVKEGDTIEAYLVETIKRTL